MKKHIPNTLTICNLLCGCCAVFFGFRAIIDGNFALQLYFVLASAVFDFLDGFTARLLKAYSPMGKELDSLADTISFGLAPSAVIAAMLGKTLVAVPDWLPFTAFLIAAFSALRLAKFNIDERQTSSFIGLPTPANAIFWAGLANTYGGILPKYPYILLILTAISCFLLVCNLPMFSLKFKSMKFKENVMQYIFLIISAVFLIVFQLKALVFIILLYIIMSIINAVYSKK